ncbi:DUF3617 family protein [Phenylobacterium sp.]|uniref:DUF3617 family protein n=1 Tax=Phenylobacterium sp. TaxID=1871053 RepID=UPI0035AD9160|nr:hypothetical protein [Pseudomonadota bacterium]
MRRLLPFLVPLALAACSQNPPAQGAGAVDKADAGEAPLAGLWKTTTTVNGRKALGENQTCMAADALGAGAPEGEAAAAGCTTTSRQARAGGYSYELVCEQDGVRSVVSGEVRRAARRTTATSTTRMFGPDGKEAAPAATVVVESTFAGPCPAGMKPGDFVQQGVG